MRRIAGKLRPDDQEELGHQEEVRPIDLSLLPDGCHILMQVNNFEAGGLENVVLDLNLILQKAGYQVVLAVLGKSGAAVERARQQGIPVVILSKSHQSYARLLEHIKPKLVLTHYSTYGAAACAQARIPFVQVIHNTYMWLSPAELADLRDSARYTTGFVAVSDYSRHYSITRLGLDAAKCLAIPNGIDTRRFIEMDTGANRSAIRKELGISLTDFVFLSVGSVNHQKNHISTLRAFAAATPDMPLARLVIVGPAYEPVLLNEINTFIAAQGLRDRVTYLGAAKSAEPYYAMADAFVSAAYFEGGQLTLLEAVCANLSVITTEVGFAFHFKGIEGIEVVAPPLDIVEFRKQIWEMRSGQRLVEQLAQAMRRVYRVRRRPNLPLETVRAFDMANTYACYLDLVSLLLQGKGWEAGKCRRSWPEQIAHRARENVAA
jgi:glycosyltransferase involved in cell wall biosynthesis